MKSVIARTYLLLKIYHSLCFPCKCSHVNSLSSFCLVTMFNDYTFIIMSAKISLVRSSNRLGYAILVTLTERNGS